MMHKPLISADLIVIDGDRGKNYPKQEDFMTSGHCIFLNATNVTKNGFDFSECIFISEEKNNILGKGIVKANDIVLTTRGTVGNSGFYSEIIAKNFSACRINSGMVILRCNSEKLNPYFVYIFIKSDLFLSQVDALRSGSAQPQLPIRDIKQITIPDLPLQKQHGIASILGSLDDKIDLNRRTNETLEAMARALFRDWFVDFGPTRAKMAGEAPYLAPELWELFPDRLDDEEKPEGWQITRIGDCIERLKVGTLYSQKDLQLSGTVPVLDQGKNGIIGYHNNAPNIVATPNERVCTFANHTCTQKLIDFPFSTIQNVIPFKGKNFPSEWIFFATLGKQNFQEYKGHWPDFIEQTICTPDKSDVVNFYRKMIDPMLNKQSENTREIETLTQLRDLLLPKLMSGEISIRDAEKMVEDAA
ncbi:restriction endonuclease subunit S [Acetobacter orientalis]|uniref:restriction endonuclease subunit S n=1 Tax=Acetobacter orientalis TaxID=146474 RepID=UPI0038664FFE